MKPIPLRPKPKPTEPDPITLLCRWCGRSFKTPTIVDVCPICHRHQPINLGGDFSGC